MKFEGTLKEALTFIMQGHKDFKELGNLKVTFEKADNKDMAVKVYGELCKEKVDITFTRTQDKIVFNGNLKDFVGDDIIDINITKRIKHTAEGELLAVGQSEDFVNYEDLPDWAKDKFKDFKEEGLFQRGTEYRRKGHTCESHETREPRIKTEK